MDHVTIYTDGAARGNPGNGGYGAVLLFVDAAGQEHRLELSGGFRNTTNNRMELLAAVEALGALKRPCTVELHSDSQYLVNAFNKNWISGWKRKGWKNAKKEPVANRDLWERLITVAAPHQVTWLWVKGHAGHALNERCDQLATQAADDRSCWQEDEGYLG